MLAPSPDRRASSAVEKHRDRVAVPRVEDVTAAWRPSGDTRARLGEPVDPARRGAHSGRGLEDLTPVAGRKAARCAHADARDRPLCTPAQQGRRCRPRGRRSGTEMSRLAAMRPGCGRAHGAPAAARAAGAHRRRRRRGSVGITRTMPATTATTAASTQTPTSTPNRAPRRLLQNGRLPRAYEQCRRQRGRRHERGGETGDRRSRAPPAPQHAEGDRGDQPPRPSSTVHQRQAACAQLRGHDRADRAPSAPRRWRRSRRRAEPSDADTAAPPAAARTAPRRRRAARAAEQHPAPADSIGHPTKGHGQQDVRPRCRRTAAEQRRQVELPGGRDKRTRRSPSPGSARGRRAAGPERGSAEAAPRTDGAGATAPARRRARPSVLHEEQQDAEPDQRDDRSSARTRHRRPRGERQQNRRPSGPSIAPVVSSARWTPKPANLGARASTGDQRVARRRADALARAVDEHERRRPTARPPPREQRASQTADSP